MPFRDPAKKAAYQREWLRRNAERHRELTRAGVKRWRKRHYEAHRAYRRKYHAQNSERLNAQNAEWHSNHPEVHRVAGLLRRARQASAEGTFTTFEWRDLIAGWGGRCAYCGRDGPLQADHRIPLVRGGCGSIDNILPACPRCNQRKHVLTEDEFRTRLAEEGLCWLPLPLQSTSPTTAG